MKGVISLKKKKLPFVPLSKYAALLDAYGQLFTVAFLLVPPSERDDFLKFGNSLFEDVTGVSLESALSAIHDVDDKEA